jgi:nucleotide-binding universal stress UspA family protein
MFKLKTIVLATDFSECSDYAQSYACALAAQFQAELHVLHVMPDPLVDRPDYGLGLMPLVMDNVEECRQQAEHSAHAEMSRRLGSAWNQCPHIVLAARFGVPFHQIVDYAREHSADLLVIGTHGRSGFVHMLLGSVAEKVVRKAGCPVLTVGPRGQATATSAAQNECELAAQ